jgi:hypothetical protein
MATSTQSGDSEDSVAAVQDARAPIRFALGSWHRRVDIRPWIFHEPKGRASSPLRTDSCDHDFLQCKGRRAPQSYAA